MPDLTSFSNGFLFLLKVARVEGVCGVAPHPLSLIAGFGQGMCLQATSGQSGVPRREGTTLLCPFCWGLPGLMNHYCCIDARSEVLVVSGCVLSRWSGIGRALSPQLTVLSGVISSLLKGH